MAGKNVQLPDGSVVAFPDGMSDGDIGTAIQKHQIASGANLPGVPPAPKPQMDTSALGKLVPAAQTASDITQGIGEGAINTLANAGKWTDPALRHIFSPQQMAASDQNIKRLTTPDNTTQSVAKTGEQIGEFLTPTGLESEAGKLLPKAPLIPKMIAGALDAGIKNKAQGGDFTTGAEAGGGGEVLGAGLQKLAPKLAESALGVTGRMRGHGRTIGNAVLDATKGLSPSTVADSTQSTLSSLNNELESRAAASTKMASTVPALTAIQDEVTKAGQKNAGETLDKLNQVWDRLTQEHGSGNPIPTDMSPTRILALKRGIGDLITKWTPEERQSFSGILQRVYGQLDSELDRTVPGADKLNQKMSSLIPAGTRAEIEANNASTLQRVLGRVAKPTGALVGAGIGYHEGGVPGAIAGLVLPEVLSSPTAKMAAARMFNSPSLPKIIAGAALQGDRPNTEAKDLKSKGKTAAQGAWDAATK